MDDERRPRAGFPGREEAIRLLSHVRERDGELLNEWKSFYRESILPYSVSGHDDEYWRNEKVRVENKIEYSIRQNNLATPDRSMYVRAVVLQLLAIEEGAKLFPPFLFLLPPQGSGK